MKTTEYFPNARMRPDRAIIRDEWIVQVCRNPQYRKVQTDSRIQCWGRIPEAENRYLRVVLLDDAETVHNAFFDRRLKP